MDLRRLRAGEYLLALSGAVLLIALFLPWYERDGDGLSGWEAFSVVDVVLAGVAGAALASLVITATQATPALSISFEALTVLAGLVASVLVLIRVIDLPDLGPGYGMAVGSWLGLAGALGVVGSGMVAIRDERLSPPGRTTDLTGRPIAAPPQIEKLPPPRPGRGEPQQ